MSIRVPEIVDVPKRERFRHEAERVGADPGDRDALARAAMIGAPP